VSYNLTPCVKNCFKDCHSKRVGFWKELWPWCICIQLRLAVRFIFENGENNTGCCQQQFNDL